MNALAQRAAWSSPASVRSSLRVDPYGPYHKGLRSHLHTVLSSLGKLDVADTAQLATVLLILPELFAHVKRQIDLENTFIHPLLERAQSGCTERAAADHLSHEQSLSALTKAIDQLARRSSLGFMAEAQALARSVYLHLSCFVAENLEHMHHEETDLLRLLWLTYDDAELDALNARLVRCTTAPEDRQIVGWIFVAAAPRERQRILEATLREFSADTLQATLDLARSQMSEAEYSTLLLDIELAHLRPPNETHA